jgi:uncharacterized protein YbjT (DUF2867 family)
MIAPRLGLIPPQSLRGGLRGKGRVHNPHQVVRDGEIKEFRAVSRQPRQRPAGADVVVVVMGLDAQDAPGGEDVGCGQNRFYGHRTFTTSPVWLD